MFDFTYLANLLGNVKHFQSMPPEQLKYIIESGSVHHYNQGSTIYLEGESCAGMYVLLKGQIQLQKMGPDGKRQILSIITPVIMFNEVPVLDDGPNVATAIASQNSTCWCIQCEVFLQLLDRIPTMGIGLLKVMAARNRMLISHYEDLSFRSVVARTAKLLIDLSQEGSVAIDRQIHPNGQLAAMVAAGPESFSRSLGMLRKNGFINCSREFISIIETNALAELALIELV